MIKYRYWTPIKEKIGYVDIQQVLDDENLIFKYEIKKNKNNKIDLTFYTPYLIRDDYMRKINDIINTLDSILLNLYEDNELIQSVFDLGNYLINNIFKEIQATHTDSILVIQRRLLGKLENFYD